jgi:hypothetical protein
MSKILETVEEAALFLDSQDPDWFNRVDLSKLDMDSCYNCVIGQAFGRGYAGDYANAIRMLPGCGTNIDYDAVFDPVFFCNYDRKTDTPTDCLNRQWKAEIEKRVAAMQVDKAPANK